MIVTVFDTGANESSKQRMRRERLRFEFWMELAADKPRMIGHFNDLNVHAVRSASADAESSPCQNLGVFGVEFVAVAMALRDFGCAVSVRSEGAGFKLASPSS